MNNFIVIEQKQIVMLFWLLWKRLQQYTYFSYEIYIVVVAMGTIKLI